MDIHQQKLYDEIFYQIPCLRFASINAPYIGKNYDSDENCKILVILSSVYRASDTAEKGLSISDFYKVQSVNENKLFYPEYSKENYYSICADTNPVRRIRQKIEQAVTSVSLDKTLEDIAHYHFILRPLRGTTEKPSSIDLDYAIEAFPKIIDILKPTHILFFGNDCLRTISRRAFTKPVENKSIERFLTDKGIVFSTISRRADYQAKASPISNQKEINDLLNQLEEQANKMDELNRQMELRYGEINKVVLAHEKSKQPFFSSEAVQNEKKFEKKFDSSENDKNASKKLAENTELGAAAAVGGAIGVAASAVGSALSGAGLASLGIRVAAPVAAPVIGPIVAGALTGVSTLALVNKLRKLIKNEDFDERVDETEMDEKTKVIIECALKNKKNFSTTSFSVLAELFKRRNLRTARGEIFSADGNGPLLLVNKVFRKVINRGDYNTAVAIAMTFVNNKTGLPWILNETIDGLVKKGTIIFEGGILKSPVTDEPVTEADISPKLVRNASIKGVDDKLKDMLVDYLEKKQKHNKDALS